MVQYIFNPFTNNLDAIGTEGTLSPITTIEGDTGSATGTTITIYANQAALNSGSSVAFTNSGSTSTLNLSDSLLNTIIGNGSGNASISGGSNTSLGNSNFTKLSSGTFNCCFGRFSGDNISTSSNNTFIGGASGAVVSTGGNNCGFGGSSLGNGNGSYNIAIGESSGGDYTGTESSNICIGNSGTLGESNVTRIGTQGTGNGQQSTCYIAGITGVGVSNLNYVTINTSTGQLGSVSSIDYTTASTAVSANISTNYLGVTSNASARTITLLTADVTVSGTIRIIKDEAGTAGSANAITIVSQGSENIDGSSSVSITANYGCLRLISRNSQWWTI